MSDPFTEIRYVGDHRADVLRNAGYDSLDELSQASRDEIASIDGFEDGIAERVVRHFKNEQ
ncbi:helix-hairpin-helix domain-containing protein [Natronomonas pharaonis]|uniref:helix-hairpin-helix domain-containing protein n=1 Tax=Natronomonas pharaonis TaxID=2257 RepID=UPI0009FF1601|nr:helix-hairpin-helix domain-containing protein [Natronomonas pharaonis]